MLNFKKNFLLIILMLFYKIIFCQLLWMTPKKCDLTVSGYEIVNDYQIFYPKYDLLLDPHGMLYYKNKLIYIDTIKPPTYTKSFFELFNEKYIVVTFFNEKFTIPYLINRNDCYIFDYKKPQIIYHVKFDSLYIHVYNKSIISLLEYESKRLPFPNADGISKRKITKKVVLTKINNRKKNIKLQYLNDNKIIYQMKEFRNPLFM